MPFSTRVENPVSLPVGYEPILPLIVVVPVLVMPAPASTANDPALPRGTDTDAASAVPGRANNIAIETEADTAVTTPTLRYELLRDGMCPERFILFSPVLSVFRHEEDDGLAHSEKIDFFGH